MQHTFAAALCPLSAPQPRAALTTDRPAKRLVRLHSPLRKHRIAHRRKPRRRLCVDSGALASSLADHRSKRIEQHLCPSVARTDAGGRDGA